LTEHKRNEQIVAAERLARSILEQAAEAIVVCDEKGRIIRASQAAQRFCDGSPLLRPFAEMFPLRIDASDPFLLAPVLQGETLQNLDVALDRQGQTFGLILNAGPLLSGQQVLGCVVTLTDITDRKRLEQERIELEVRVRQQQKLEAIGILASGVAHEINNPINGIMNYAQRIADTTAPDHPAAGYAQEILQETVRVATIVRNLLQFARQEQQAHSPARIADIVEQTLSLLRAVFRRDQITLDVDVPDGLPTIKCRSQQIQQVLMNLLTNARDALNAKYPGYHEAKTLRITARVLSGISDVPSQGTAVPQSQIANPKSQMADRWLRLTVADQGTGIPPEIQARIFDPFFTTKPRDKGTGLGLSISHGIVKDHHGVLHFETAPGIGTQFHLDLPVDNGWTVEEE
jgi:signal transduction histidine kinase